MGAERSDDPQRRRVEGVLGEVPHRGAQCVGVAGRDADKVVRGWRQHDGELGVDRRHGRAPSEADVKAVNEARAAMGRYTILAAEFAMMKARNNLDSPAAKEFLSSSYGGREPLLKPGEWEALANDLWRSLFT